MKVRDLELANHLPFVLIAGPCQVESLDHALYHASTLMATCRNLNVPFIYKSSFDKANRTSKDSPRGAGQEEGLAILRKIRDLLGCPVTTDVHEVAQVAAARNSIDLLQIPAFLSRQTDLLVAAGQSGLPVNVKKGQFMAPEDMQYVVGKVGGEVLLTERGTSFGYHNLVVDYRGLDIMRGFGPVCFDATHSTQRPSHGSTSGGDRHFTPSLARAAVAIGVAAVFIECHEDPDNAPSDGRSMVYLREMPHLVADLQMFDKVAKGY